MLVSKKNVPPRIRTTPLSIFVASPFSGDGSVHGKAKSVSPGTPLRAASGRGLNASARTPDLRTAGQQPRRMPSSRSGLTSRSRSTPSLVDDRETERGSSVEKGRLASTPSRGQRAGGRDRPAGGAPLKNYHSETSLNDLAFAPAALGGEEETSRLAVAVRVRPLSAAEAANPAVTNVVAVQGNEVSVACEQARCRFAYDHCFWSCDRGHPQFATQEDVFATLVRPLIDKVLEGYNTCLFAYGQTGSGKTYSMTGEDLDSPEGPGPGAGVIPRFCHELFGRVAGDGRKVEMTYCEVYNERIHDLLDRREAAGRKCLRVREHPSLGPYVEDLAVKEVRSLREVLEWLKIGNNQRVTASTEMNEKSSRSHSIFSLTLTQTQVELVMGETMVNTRSSRCNLVDLAGSERVAQTCSSGERRKEGVSINQSLLTLGKVISSLAEHGGSRKSFAPYRESLLTFLLKESLGGNSRTVMLATVSPASCHADETVATLRYACQARKIVNRVRVNEVPQISVISLTAEVARLNAAREQYEGHLKTCGDDARSREALAELRRQHDDHLRGCRGAEETRGLRAELEELRRAAAAASQGEAALKEELRAVRREYDAHLGSCRPGVDAERVQQLADQLQLARAELAQLRSRGQADETRAVASQCDEWREKCAGLERRLEESQQLCKQQDKELSELKHQHLKEQSDVSNQLNNFNVQLKSIKDRFTNLPQFYDQPLPASSYENTADSLRTRLLKKLASALSNDKSTSASEITSTSEDIQSPLSISACSSTVNEADLSSPQLEITLGRLSTGSTGTDNTDEDALDQTQSFISQGSSTAGPAEETAEEILYYLQDGCDRLRERCGGGERVGAAVARLSQAVGDLQEALLETPSQWELSSHFSPPSPSVTPAKPSLRSPAVARQATPKCVSFRLRDDADADA
ncbi:kinesin-like protein klp-20 isoform X2 [Bacillus rossius redtenbacheri]|uniref:kinesin-like protein klp-20 isoform X2 n=1 Tax=Bacillus rossius redtenbacheri TaxID=93214 RepID=UPI002FDCA9FF